MDEVFSELSEPLMSEEKKNFSPKTIYIEQTLDWSEARQAKLLAKGDIQSASSLSSEFYEWMKAPEGFDHDVLIPEDPK